jgi:hypothetical protein
VRLARGQRIREPRQDRRNRYNRREKIRNAMQEKPPVRPEISQKTAPGNVANVQDTHTKQDREPGINEKRKAVGGSGHFFYRFWVGNWWENGGKWREMDSGKNGPKIDGFSAKIGRKRLFFFLFFCRRGRVFFLFFGARAFSFFFFFF